MQSVSRAAKFTLEVENPTVFALEVLSGDIKIVNPGKDRTTYFNPTYIVCILAPGRRVKMSTIVISEGYGYIADMGHYALATASVSIPLDIQPIIPQYPELGGVSSSVADPRQYRVAFTTNGDIDPRELVRRACKNIVERARAVGGMLADIRNEGNEYVLSIAGESYTIGELLCRNIFELYPSIECVNYAVPLMSRSLTLRIKTNEDVPTMIMAAIDRIANTYVHLETYFRRLPS
jgi:DNA-directed RNA polymerase subunit L